MFKGREFPYGRLHNRGLLDRPNRCHPHIHDRVYVINRQGKDIGNCGLTSEVLDIEFNFRDGDVYTRTLTDKPVRKYMGNLKRKIKLTKSEEKRKSVEEQLKRLESADKIVVERHVSYTWDYYT
jgi:hypothetical protein